MDLLDRFGLQRLPPSITAGLLTGNGVVVLIVVTLEVVGLAHLGKPVPAVSLAVLLGLGGCTLGTAVYWARRDEHPTELDVWYVAVFTLTASFGMFLWPVARGLALSARILAHEPLALPIAIFFLSLFIAVGFALCAVTLVLGGLVGTVATAGVTYYCTVFNE